MKISSERAAQAVAIGGEFADTMRMFPGSDRHCRHLAMGLVTEAAEVLDLFKKAEVRRAPHGFLFNGPGERETLAGELADVAIYLVQLADVYAVDLDQAMMEKLVKVSQRLLKGDGTSAADPVQGFRQPPGPDDGVAV